MKKSVKVNYIYNLLYQMLIIILPLVTTPYLARTIGLNGSGIYGYTISIVTYFVLFGILGVPMYGQREIAYDRDDEYKRSKIFKKIKKEEINELCNRINKLGIKCTFINI